MFGQALLKLSSCRNHRLALLSSLVIAAMFTMEAPIFASPASPICDPMHYGAKADGITKDTKALQRAIDTCAASGGGTVQLRSGTFLTGPITLRSHITLEIDPAATLLGSQNKEDYPEEEELREASVEPLIHATDAEDITIFGGGTIDGAGQPWWQMVRAGKADHKVVAAKRPRLLVLDHCRHVLIDGVTIQNSASWQVVPYYSDDVTIRNGKILAPANSPNTDGIDPFSSHHVTISHMLIDVGDDNVAIKSGQPGSPGPDDPSTDITITDCTFLHGHGMSIGSEISGGVQRVRAARISFKDTANGVRVKSNRDRGNDIGDLDFRDLTMENVQTPILVSEYYPKIPEHDAAQPVTRLTPHFHDISVPNLHATGAKTAGVIVGLPESPLTSITLTNVEITAETGMTIGNATVTAHDFNVRAAAGLPITLLENAKIIGTSPAVAQSLKPIRIILVGDSTMAVKSGWGPGFCAVATPQVDCVNMAKGGRSSGSYRAEGSWAQVMEALQHNADFEATYVLVQFGHNDQPGKPGRSTDLATEFPANMQRYVEDIRSTGATPVLITPLTRRQFRNGTLVNDLVPWAAATSKVAAEEHVPLLTLNSDSAAAVQSMGQAEADSLAMAPPPPVVVAGESTGTSVPAPKAPASAAPSSSGDGLTAQNNTVEKQGSAAPTFDYTHLGAKGSAYFAHMVAMELVVAIPDLKPYLNLTPSN